LTNPDQVKEILASAGTQTLLAEHGESAGSSDSTQLAPAAAAAPSHPGPAITPAVSRRGAIGYSLEGNGPRGAEGPPQQPPESPGVVAPGGRAPPEVKPAKADPPQESTLAPPSLTLPTVAGDGQQGIASPPLPDAPPPPAPAKSGVAGALRHAKRGLRHLGEKIVHP